MGCILLIALLAVPIVAISNTLETCSAGDRAYMEYTELSKAKHVLIAVDDLDDRIDDQRWESDAVAPRSLDASCTAVPTEYLGARNSCGRTGRCTLRAALELAATLSQPTATTIIVRAGTIRVQARLPDVLGTVQIIGYPSGPPPGLLSSLLTQWRFLVHPAVPPGTRSQLVDLDHPRQTPHPHTRRCSPWTMARLRKWSTVRGASAACRSTRRPLSRKRGVRARSMR